MGIIDKIATVVSDKINANNDEVMLLTQENEKLGYELNQTGEELRLSESERKKWEEFNYKTAENLQSKVLENIKLNSELTRSKSKYNEVKKRMKDLSESGERQVDVIQEYSERIIELENEKPDKKLKQRNKELEKLLKDSEDLIEANTIYRMTYEYISDEANRQMIIDNFSHNLSKWIGDKNLTDTEVAKKLGTSRNIVGNLRTGNWAVNVNTIQKFDIELCEYFECSVYELVTEKMEKSEGRRSDQVVVK